MAIHAHEQNALRAGPAQTMKHYNTKLRDDHDILQRDR